MRDRYAIRDGKIQSNALEINVVEHCNLACRACSHLSPVVPPKLVDNDELERDLGFLAKHYHVERVRLLGGEPLLHPDLRSVIDVVRASGVGDEISITTNGVLLPRMDETFWRGVDRISLSQYPGHSLADDDREACKAKARRFGVKLHIRPYEEFRESYSELGTSDDRLIRKIYHSCTIAHEWRCHSVAGGYFFKCPPSYFIPKMLDSAGNIPPDGLRIEDAPDFGRQLMEFLTSAEPLSSCRNCLGTAGRRFPHQQVSRRNFRELQKRSTEDLIDRGGLGRLEGARNSVVRIRRRLGNAAGRDVGST